MAEWIAVLSDEEIRRERAKARELRQSQWWKRRRASGVCHYCGGTFAARTLTKDHVVPLVRVRAQHARKLRAGLQGV